jgi:hypothetical protein
MLGEYHELLIYKFYIMIPYLLPDFILEDEIKDQKHFQIRTLNYAKFLRKRPNYKDFGILEEENNDDGFFIDDDNLVNLNLIFDDCILRFEHPLEPKYREFIITDYEQLFFYLNSFNTYVDSFGETQFFSYDKLNIKYF